MPGPIKTDNFFKNMLNNQKTGKKYVIHKVDRKKAIEEEKQDNEIDIRKTT